MVLASGANPADALAATPLAAALNAAVLLTPAGSLDLDTTAALRSARANGAKRVIVVGGLTAVGRSVESQVRSLGFEVERIAGADRFATAVELSVRTQSVYRSAGTEVGAVFFVDGTQFADALAAGPAAAAKSGVILLTRGAMMPGVSKTRAKSLGVQLFALGGKAAVASGAMGAEAVVGADRVETSVKAAKRFVPGALTAVVANGDGFADALSGGALAARFGGVLLLSKAGTVPSSLDAHFWAGGYRRVFVTGGVKSVSAAVLQQIRKYVG